MSQNKNTYRWIQLFRRKYGRSPRILHIGNIANNAYNNAKLLNRVGIDCDVICYDYYHVMACPEWEDANFIGEITDQNCPDWCSVDLAGFNRPRWFAQGPLHLCLKYLIARRKERKLKSNLFWFILENRVKYEEIESRILKSKRLLVGVGKNFIHQIHSLQYRWSILGRIFYYCIRAIYHPCAIILYALMLPIVVVTLAENKIGQIIKAEHPFLFDECTKELISLFNHKFPCRKDQLTASDVEMYRWVIPKWQSLFSHYDLIQAYATDPILPLLANKRPYIGFEHGTLRDFPLRESAIGRCTALSYNLADHVFITNGDCLNYAKKIGIEKFSPMIHPFDEVTIRAVKGDYKGLHDKLGVTYVFLCTLRHDWKVKGTDKYIHALPKISKIIGADFKLIMTKWGSQVKESMELAKELGVFDFIEWIEPLKRHDLFKMQKSVDILFDQIALPHFGATAPEGIAAGVPVIMSYEPSSTAWIVDKPAPILSAWNEDQIAENVKIALDLTWIEEYRKKAKEWIDKNHSSQIVVSKHINAYSKILNLDEEDIISNE